MDKGVVSWVDPVEQLNKTSNDERDWTFSSEHLFTLEVTALYDAINIYYINSNSNASIVTLSPEVVTALYQTPAYGTQTTPGFTMVGDIRGPALMLKYAGRSYQIYKFYGTGSASFRNRFPMIRLTELYMITGE